MKSAIERARRYIKEDISSSLPSGALQEQDLTPTHLHSIFSLYDEIFFQGQITTRLKELNAKIRFYTSSRSSGMGGTCGVERASGASPTRTCTYYIDIAPNIISTIFRIYPKGLLLAAGVGCEDRLECLLLIFEHELIHLLMELWAFADPSREPKNIYAPHGKLFQCMARTYFGHTRFDHDLGIPTIDVEEEHTAFKRHMEMKRIPKMGYTYWSNSCYFDSLFMVLFANVSTFWRDHLLKADVSKFIYPAKVCNGNSNMMRIISTKMQEQMKEDVASLQRGEGIVKCTDLRKLFAQCIPLQVKGMWVMFNVGSMYSSIADFFPELLLDIPIRVHSWDRLSKKFTPRSITYQKEAVSTFWDFMDPLSDVEPGTAYKEIVFEAIQTPVLVFVNGGIPRVKKMNSLEPEKTISVIDGVARAVRVTKKRAFGDRIIDGRYRIVGVVILEGVPEHGEGGSHYTAYFLTSTEKWVFYNDIGAKLVEISALPSSVWEDKDRKMPAMYFYQRVKVE